MTNYCVFRIEVEGYLWRVVRPFNAPIGEPCCYRVMHKRRIYARVKGMDAREAIELACKFALGCQVDIKWGTMV